MLTGFSIAEKYAVKNEFRRICQAVLMAQDIQENSWDEQGNRYRKTISEAAMASAKHFDLDAFWADIIGLWNDYDWNEIQEQAQLWLKRDGE